MGEVLIPRRNEPGPGAVRRGAIPTAENVPTVQTQRDPGVNVPDFGRFNTGVGDISGVVSDISARMQIADDNIRKAEESFNRQQAETELDKTLNDEFNARKLTKDMSLTAEVEDYGKWALGEREKIIAKYPGSKVHEFKLREGLEQIHGNVATNLSIAVNKIKEEKTDKAMGQFITGLVQESNRGVPLEESVAKLQARIEKGRDHTPVEKEIQYLQEGTAMLAMNKFENFLVRGAFNEAETVLETPGVANLIGNKAFSDLSVRLSGARQKARSEALKPLPPLVTKPGDVLRDPRDPSKIIATNPPEEKPIEVGAVNDDGTTKGSQFLLSSEVTRRLKAGEKVPGRERTPLISPNESAFLAGIGKDDADRQKTYQNEADVAQKEKVELDRLSAAIESDKFTPGSFGTERAALSRFMSLLGVDGSEYSSLLGDEPTADIIDTAANRLALEEFKETGGRATNLYIKTVLGALPALTRTKEGNEILIEVMQRWTDRKIKIADMSDKFLDANGTYRPKGKKTFFQIVRDDFKDDPVVTEQMLTRIQGVVKKAPSRSEFVTGSTGSKPLPDFAKDKPDGFRVEGLKKDGTRTKVYEKKGNFLVPVE